MKTRGKLDYYPVIITDMRRYKIILSRIILILICISLPTYFLFLRDIAFYPAITGNCWHSQHWVLFDPENCSECLCWQRALTITDIVFCIFAASLSTILIFNLTPSRNKVILRDTNIDI